MAKVQNPLIGRASGKFASAVFSTRYGQNIIRSRPVEFRDKQSSAQLSQRSKFVIAQQWVIKFLTILRTGFASLAVNKSAYIAALSWYLENGITGSPGSYAIDYPNAKFSFGTLLPIVEFTTMGAYDSPDLALAWTDNSGSGNASASDIVTIIIYNATQSKYAQMTAVRGDGEVDDDYSGFIPVVGDVLYLYCFCANTAFTLISNTSYIGTITVTSS